MKRDKIKLKIKKPLIVRFYGYSAYIPFYFAFLSIRDSYQLLDIVLFASGLLFLTIFLVINQIEPILVLTVDKLIFYNRFRNKPGVEPISSLKQYKLIDSNRISFEFEHKSYEVRSSKSNIKRIKTLLEEYH